MNEILENPAFNMASNSYIIRNHIMVYLNDAIQQLLEVKNTNPKINVLEFFSEYFKSVIQGKHILFREYAFVSATPHNRACFVQKFFSTYSHLILREEPMSAKEYHALITLISFDFPLEVVEKSFKISCDQKSSLLFKDFIYYFQFQFYYQEYIEDLMIAYDNPDKFLEELKRKKGDIEMPEQNEYKKHELKRFLTCVNLIEDSKTSNYSIPPISVVGDYLDKDKVNFDLEKVLCDMSKNEVLIKEIGKLPVVDEIGKFSNISQEADKEFLNSEKEVKPVESKPILPVRPQVEREKSIFRGPIMVKTSSDTERTSSSESSSDTDT